MSAPLQPPASRRPARVDPLGAPWPGLIPLRPQTITDLLSGAVRLVQRRAAVLCPAAFGFAAASAGVQIGVLSMFPADQRVLSDDWVQRAMAGQMSIPAGVIWPALAGSLVGLLGTLVVAGMAAACAASDVLDIRAPHRQVLSRLGSRWPALLAVAAVVAVAVTVGVVALIVPGAIALGMLSLAVPAVPMERAGVAVALRRGVQLSRGFRWRILGVLTLALVISALVSTVLQTFLPVASTVGELVLSLVLAAVVSALTTPWVGSVLALLYIDIRIRKENLAGSLIRASMRG